MIRIKHSTTPVGSLIEIEVQGMSEKLARVAQGIATMAQDLLEDQDPKESASNEIEEVVAVTPLNDSPGPVERDKRERDEAEPQSQAVWLLLAEASAAVSGFCLSTPPGRKRPYNYHLIHSLHTHVEDWSDAGSTYKSVDHVGAWAELKGLNLIDLDVDGSSLEDQQYLILSRIFDFNEFVRLVTDGGENLIQTRLKDQGWSERERILLCDTLYLLTDHLHRLPIEVDGDPENPWGFQRVAADGRVESRSESQIQARAAAQWLLNFSKFFQRYGL